MQVSRSAKIVPGLRFCRPLVVAVLVSLTSGGVSAQMGPVDTEGYVEYRYSQFNGAGLSTRSSHGVLARTNLSTFFWRPWILNATGHLGLSQRKSDARLGNEKSGDLFGGLRLNFLARSAFPLSLYYEDRDGNVDSEVSSRSGRIKNYGLIQRYTSRRLGTYSFEWRKGSIDTLYQDGFRLPQLSDSENWQFLARKTIGRNMFTLTSRGQDVHSQIPERTNNSLRHSLRHSFRIGSGFDVTNTAFHSDEELDSEMLNTGRTYRQLNSIVSWRPLTEKRLLISGRGLIQDSEFRNTMATTMTRSASASATANYQYSDQVILTAGLGFVLAENDGGTSNQSMFQRVGANYNSVSFPLFSGAYRYSSRVSVGNQSNSHDIESGDLQDLATSLGHSFSRSLNMGAESNWDLRLSQQATTVHDTVGRERHALHHSIAFTNGARSGNMNRYFRLSLLDQRDFADNRRTYQLANVQYSLQGQLTRNRSWNINAMVQYGQRVQEKPVSQATDTASLSYSVTMNYRHADLLDVNNLMFTSDLRWLSEDFRTEDPFDPDFNVESERLNSSWRNRLEYRVGLLQMRADLDLREVSDRWSLSVLVTMRRYFGRT